MLKIFSYISYLFLIIPFFYVIKKPINNYLIKKRYYFVSQSKYRKIAIIPAHNECRVIKNLIKDLKREHFNHIIVFSDFSTDCTNDLKDVLLVKCKCKSKSKVLTLATSRLHFISSDYVFFFDADNRLPANFLSRIPIVDTILQVRINTFSFSSFISRYYSILFDFASHFQVAISPFSLLAGTGFYIRGSVLSRYPFIVRTLLDDMEYSFIVPVRIYYFDHIFVLNENPNNFFVSVRQFLRWFRGSYQILFFCSPFRLKFYILLFPLINIFSLFSLYSLFFSFASFPLSFLFSSLFSAFYFSLFVYPDTFWHLSVFDFLFFPLYSFFLLFISLYALFTFYRRNWYRTPHKGIRAG